MRSSPPTGRFATATSRTSGSKESAPTARSTRSIGRSAIRLSNRTATTGWRWRSAICKLPLAAVSHRELLYQMQSFAKVEIADGRAIVWKQFRADEPLTNGDRYTISAQSVYRLHRIDGQWQIVGFVGYLPLEASAA